MERKIIITSDGSKTIYIPELNECYHSKNGALAESMHIFINAGYRFAAENKQALNILEIGFGTGLNALLTLIETINTAKKVYYLGVEPYRVDKKMLDGLNYPELTGVPEANNYFEEIHKTTSAKQITQNFTLCVSEKKIEDIILLKSFFDLVYFDAFAPDVQPELWRLEIFDKIAASMKKGGVLVTYSCKGDVKRALESAGFSIEKLPGPVGKREFLRGLKKKFENIMNVKKIVIFDVLIFFMKTLKTLLIAFGLFCLGTAMLHAQTFDRIAISSGGISSDTINATIGEIFVFTLNDSTMSLDAGSQSSTGNTGIIITTVAKTENTQSEILVYPNPVDDFLNLQINGLQSENISFQVYDVTGKNVLTQNITGNNSLYRLNVHELSAGDYFVRGYTSQGLSFRQIKFVKL